MDINQIPAIYDTRPLSQFDIFGEIYLEKISAKFQQIFDWIKHFCVNIVLFMITKSEMICSLNSNFNVLFDYLFILVPFCHYDGLMLSVSIILFIVAFGWCLYSKTYIDHLCIIQNISAQIENTNECNFLGKLIFNIKFNDISSRSENLKDYVNETLQPFKFKKYNFWIILTFFVIFIVQIIIECINSNDWGFLSTILLMKIISFNSYINFTKESQLDEIQPAVIANHPDSANI